MEHPCKTNIVEDKLEASEVAIPAGDLYALIPAHSGRYDVVKRVERQHVTIEAGMFMAARCPVPQYLPQQWSPCTHPEGKIYFYRDAQLRVVTDAYLYDPDVAEKVMTWVAHIEKLAVERSFTMTDSVELYVKIDDDDDCHYYFADHAARALFWLDTYDTTDLGLLSVASGSHLKIQLEEQYWLHVEYFCMHPIKFNANIIEEMISLLTHGCGDHMTSTSSTFPYSLKDCKGFLKLLYPYRDQVNDGKIITLVARLNTVIVANQYYTYYGQEQARLSRNTSIVANQMEEISWTQPISSAISFGASSFFHSRLNETFTDNYVYISDWNKLMTDAVNKWRNAYNMSLGLLILHVLCFYLPVSRALALISGACLSLCLLSATLLIHQFEDQIQTGSCGYAYDFLLKNRLPKIGYQGLALVFALPQAFNLWGLFLLFAQAFTVFEPLYLACAASSIIIIIALLKLFKFFASNLIKRSKEPISPA